MENLGVTREKYLEIFINLCRTPLHLHKVLREITRIQTSKGKKPTSERVQCQVCSKPGHVVVNCYPLMDLLLSSNGGKHMMAGV